MGPDAMILVFLMLSFKPAFSLCSFTFIKRLVRFPFCHLRGIICNLKLLIFLLPVLIPACDSSNLAFHMMYSAYKINKQGTIYNLDILLSNFEPVRFPCSVLSAASWLAYRFLRRQVRWTGIPISLRNFRSLLSYLLWYILHCTSYLIIVCMKAICFRILILYQVTPFCILLFVIDFQFLDLLGEVCLLTFILYLLFLLSNVK